MMRFLSWLAGLPARFYLALIDLTEQQQRALMTWGMLLGIAAIEGLVWWSLGRVSAQYRPGASETVVLSIIETYRDAIRLAFVLMGLFASGIVLIARGGAMSIKLPGGTEIIASAGAAKALATDTNVKDITQPTPGDGQ
jgi:hypothetical protein